MICGDSDDGADDDNHDEKDDEGDDDDDRITYNSRNITIEGSENPIEQKKTQTRVVKPTAL